MIRSGKNKIVTKLSRHCLGTVITAPDEPRLKDGLACKEHVDSLLVYLGIKNLGDLLYPFPNDSFSLLVNLAESHIAVHTWPEQSTVQLDVFLCNYHRDNTEMCQQIYDSLVKYFRSQKVDTITLKRR